MKFAFMAAALGRFVLEAARLLLMDLVIRFGVTALERFLAARAGTTAEEATA